MDWVRCLGKRIFLIWVSTMIQICYADIDWSEPQTVFSSGTEEGSLPAIAFDPTEAKAQAVWITEQTNYKIYGCSFQENSWGTPTTILTSSASPSSLQIGCAASHCFTAVWSISDGTDLWIQSADNTGEEWSSAQNLYNIGVISDELNLQFKLPVISWQQGDHRIHAATYQGGTISLPYFLNPESLGALQAGITPSMAFFTTSAGFYVTPFDPFFPPTDPSSEKLSFTSYTLFHSTLDTNSNQAAAIVQDQNSQFLLALLQQGSNGSFSLIDTSSSPIGDAKIALSPFFSIASCKAAAVWQTSSGAIRAAVFNGTRWTALAALSVNGSSPAIAFNPVNNYPVVVWADQTTKTIQVSEFDLVNWAVPQTLSATGVEVSHCQMQISSDGNALVIWARKPTMDAKTQIEAVTGSPSLLMTESLAPLETVNGFMSFRDNSGLVNR